MRIAPILCSLLLLGSVAHAADRNVDIVNKTGRTMTHFYASKVGVDTWEEDILGNDKLDDGDTQPVDIDDGTGACKFDFKAVFAGGATLEKHNIDVCKISSYTYTR